MNGITGRTDQLNLTELSRKTGLVVRCPHSGQVKELFALLEGYDSQERSDTFNFRQRALDETRSSLAAEGAYSDE